MDAVLFMFIFLGIEVAIVSAWYLVTKFNKESIKPRHYSLNEVRERKEVIKLKLSLN